MKKHYDELYKNSIREIMSDNYQIDSLIDSSTDNRFGITLLIRPGNHIKNRIQEFLNELKAIEPEQYYYPDSDIHLTVASIISCYDGFKPENITVGKYVELIKKSIKQKHAFEIEFKGITLSPSCIMIQGFSGDNTLNDIRDSLRADFKNSELLQSIDKRYLLKTAHLTTVRFRKQLTRKLEYLRIIEKYRNHNFGIFTANTLELVCNDWYHRKSCMKELYKFKIA